MTAATRAPETSAIAAPVASGLGAPPLRCTSPITGSTESMSQMEYLEKSARNTASDARRTLPVPPRWNAAITVKTASVRKNIAGTSTSMPGTCVSRYGIPRRRPPATTSADATVHASTSLLTSLLLTACNP